MTRRRTAGTTSRASHASSTSANRCLRSAVQRLLLVSTLLAACGEPAIESDAAGIDSGRTDAAMPREDARVVLPDGGDVDPFSTDRAFFFGDSRCAIAGVLFCDGFEGAAVDRGVWDGADDIVVESAQHARGSSALHVVSGNDSSV